MLNPIEAYQECGHKCAAARNEKDESRALSWREYMVRMCNLESKEDAREARAAFDLAYAKNRRLGT